MLTTPRQVNPACDGLPSALDGPAALRACMPSSQLEGPFGLDPQQAHSIATTLTMISIALVLVILFLILTGRMSIGGLFRSVSSTRQIDKMYAPAANTGSVEPVNESSAEVAPTEDEVEETDSGETSSEDPYQDVPYGRQPTWKHPSTPAPEDFFASYNTRGSAD